ncbi:MAG: hypothetical protein A2248_11835 [Candidatus Raymondbacteria bacterium RIFOXYA2_FULL_49_16]|nr:MAG: hypothetical protein A2248_11835 [Candidatus Raymondbacteria bacterium RIFOXYA2_FULL_49_16]
MEENEKRWVPSPITINGPASPVAGNNRIFDALKKAETERGQENMFDISGRMIEREKENSKRALEELWLLKKSGREEDAKTIDMLIDYYQKKIDNVREKEERLKSIGKESVKLIDEKRKWQKDLAQIIQELEECTQEIDFLRAKQEKLRLKEKEVKEKSETLFQKLSTNEKEVIDSLYTVIILKDEVATAQVVSAASPNQTPIETLSKQETVQAPAEETPGNMSLTADIWSTS